MTRTLRTLFAAALPALLPVSAAAQDIGAADRVPYRLVGDSSFQEGCFGACNCPVLIQRLRGGFLLAPAGLDGDLRRFDLEEIRWLLPHSDPEVTITGSGTYRLGEFEHQLTLDLLFNDEPVFLDSGLVPGGSRFPRITILASMFDLTCFDTVIDLDARPLLGLTLTAGGISWTRPPQVAGFDVVQGDLGILRATGGDFSEAVRACLADDLDASELSLESAPLPGPGEASWFAVRWVGPSAVGSYDAASDAQVESRDPGIQASPAACP